MVVNASYVNEFSDYYKSQYKQFKSRPLTQTLDPRVMSYETREFKENNANVVDSIYGRLLSWYQVNTTVLISCLLSVLCSWMHLIIFFILSKGDRRRSKRHNSLGSGYRLERPLVPDPGNNSDSETRNKPRQRRTYFDRNENLSPKSAENSPATPATPDEDDEKTKARMARRWVLGYSGIWITV
jgi:hypothetical protein